MSCRLSLVHSASRVAICIFCVGNGFSKGYLDNINGEYLAGPPVVHLPYIAPCMFIGAG